MDGDDPICALCWHRLVPPVRMFEHPRLSEIPICALCNDEEDGRSIDEEDDDVCFWCGDEDCGEIILCDCCDKGFCSRCIESYLGADTVQAILGTDPWSCFECDASVLAPFTLKFNAYQEEMDYFPTDINDTINRLVDVENELHRWDISLPDIEENTLREIRDEIGQSDEAQVQAEYSIAKEEWKHNIALLHHRCGELQEHYEEQGGDLKAFYEVLTKNRRDITSQDSPHPEHSGQEYDDGQNEKEISVEKNELDVSPTMVAADFVSKSDLDNLSIPVIPLRNNVSLKREKLQMSPFNNVEYYVKLEAKTGTIRSDLGEVPSYDERALAQARALKDRQLSEVCENEVSLSNLLLDPKDRVNKSTSVLEDVFSPEASNTPSIFPKVFDLHVPPSVLQYLFYAIGREYPVHGEIDKEFNINEHTNTKEYPCPASSSSSREDEKRRIRQVINRYKVPKEVLVVLKYINSSCRYMKSIPAWLRALEKKNEATIDASVNQSDTNNDDENRFSFEVEEMKEDWQNWTLSSWIHPSLMETIYKGRSEEWACLIGKFGILDEFSDHNNEEIELIPTAEDGVKTYLSYCHLHKRKPKQEIIRDLMTLPEQRSQGSSSGDIRLDSKDQAEDMEVLKENKLRSKKRKQVRIVQTKEEKERSEKEGSDCQIAVGPRSGQKSMISNSNGGISIECRSNNCTASNRELSHDSDDEQLARLPSVFRHNRDVRSSGRGSVGGGTSSSPILIDSSDDDDDCIDDFDDKCLSDSGDDVALVLPKPRKPTGSMVIPVGHYFNPESNACLPYSPFAINGREVEDLFGSEVFEENSDTIKPETFLKSREVAMHPNLSTYLKPHQKEAVQFLWKNVMIGVLKYTDEDESVGTEDENITADAKRKGQKYGRSITRVHGCILAHFMGLGKTLTIISFLTTIMKHPLLREIKNPYIVDKQETEFFAKTSAKPAAAPLPFIFRVLILAPVNVVFNWKTELKRWLPDDYVKIASNRLNYFVISGGGGVCGNQNESISNLRRWGHKGGICVMGYEQFISYQGQFKSFLEDPGPDIIVLDEAHRVKSDTSKIYKALQKVRTKRRIALTGSPLQNNLLEYFHMVNFVKMHHLNSKKHFIKYFVDPIKAGGSADASSRAKKYMKGRLHVLSKKLTQIVHRRGIAHLNKFLQRKREFILLIKLTPFQQYLYKLYLRKIMVEYGKPNVAGEHDDDDEFGAAEVVGGRGSAQGGHLFSHAQVGMLIWNHPFCLPFREFVKGQLKRKGTLVQSTPTLDSLGRAMCGVYKDFINDKPILPPQTHVTSSDVKKSESISSSGHHICSTEMNDVDENESKDDEIGSVKADTVDLADEVFEGDVDSEVLADWWKSQDANIGSNITNDSGVIASLGKGDAIGFSSKVVMLLSILMQAMEVGDKVVLFSQSLPTLSYIELILKADWGTMLDTIAAATKGRNNDGNVSDGTSLAGERVRSGGPSYDFSDVGSSSRKGWVRGSEYFRLDGGTNGHDRQDMINQFNKKSRVHLFLVSTKAGNMGSNLQSANRVVVFDASWNPVHDLQAIFRCHRYGQTKPVYVYRFLAAGTLEEVIYKRQMNKMALAARVVDDHMPLNQFASEEFEQITQSYQEEDSECDESEEEIMAKITNEDDAVLRAALINVGASRVLRGIEDMDPMLEDVEDEHLDEDEKRTAEHEYDAELNPKRILEQQQQLQLQQQLQKQQHVQNQLPIPANISQNLLDIRREVEAGLIHTVPFGGIDDTTTELSTLQSPPHIAAPPSTQQQLLANRVCESNTAAPENLALRPEVRSGEAKKSFAGDVSVNVAVGSGGGSSISISDIVAVKDCAAGMKRSLDESHSLLQQGLKPSGDNRDIHILEPRKKAKVHQQPENSST